MAKKRLYKVSFNEDEMNLLLDYMAYLEMDREYIDDIAKNIKQRNSIRRMFKRMCNIFYAYEYEDDITLGTGYLGEGEWLYHPQLKI